MAGAGPGSPTIDCEFPTEVVSVECSFDGGPSENCSFPLLLSISRFSPTNHTVEVTVVDVFGRTLTFSHGFLISECELISDINITTYVINIHNFDSHGGVLFNCGSTRSTDIRLQCTNSADYTMRF